MSGHLLGRTVQAVAIMFIVATLTFTLVHLAPGDPFSAILENPLVTPEIRARQRAAAGLDRPIPEQYVRYLRNLARGELGWSWSRSQPVASVLRSAIPNTIVLLGTALVASFALGIAVGAYQAAKRNTLVDRALDTSTMVAASFPEFWLAVLLMLTFAYWLPLFPVGGMVDLVWHDYYSPARKLLDRLYHLVLPAATLTLLFGAAIARFQRSAMLEVLPEDFVRTARAKGLAERGVIFHHALRNALLPIVSILGLALPTLFGGAVFVEIVFSWPGMGRVAWDALAARDYDLVMASVVMGSGLVVLGGVIADLMYAVVDPRLRG